MKLNAFINLLCDAFLRQAIGGIERIIAAIRAAAGSNGTVAVRTRETRINTELLKPAAKSFYAVRRKRIETPVVAPEKYLVGFFSQGLGSFFYGFNVVDTSFSEFTEHIFHTFRVIADVFRN